MNRRYKAVFFDWDGTAVLSRKAPVDEVAVPMKQLLSQGIKLVVVSGTTIENIGNGRLHEYFTPQERQNLFYGLGRGAYNYRFDEKGDPEIFSSRIPQGEELLKIHRICYEIHEKLLRDYNYPTDIVFSRPNYCKIDLMVERDRGQQLFFQSSELETVKQNLTAHGISGGLKQLIQIADDTARQSGLSLSSTTDAKYLEVGLTSKSDNVNTILDYFTAHYNITARDCSFWGDEYIGMDEGLYGSDSFMITEKTTPGDFFDVSEASGTRPTKVQVLGGGVKQFTAFLTEQAKLQ